MTMPSITLVELLFAVALTICDELDYMPSQDIVLDPRDMRYKPLSRCDPYWRIDMSNLSLGDLLGLAHYIADLTGQSALYTLLEDLASDELDDDED